MFICPSCNRKQTEGKFCENCGSVLQAGNEKSGPTAPVIPLEPNNTQTGTHDSQQHSPGLGAGGLGSHLNTTYGNEGTAQPNQNTEAFKKSLVTYWDYFIEVLKNPTLALAKNEQHLAKALVTFILFAVTGALAIYSLLLAIARYNMGHFASKYISNTIPFFASNIRLILIVAVFALLGFVSTLIIVKLTNNALSAKVIFTQFSSLAVPFMALNVFAIITGIASLKVFTIILLGLSFSLYFYYIPVVYVYEKASNIRQQGQKIYLSLATIILMTVFVWIIGTLLFMETLEGLLDSIY